MKDSIVTDNVTGNITGNIIICHEGLCIIEGWSRPIDGTDTGSNEGARSTIVAATLCQPKPTTRTEIHMKTSVIQLDDLFRHGFQARESMRPNSMEHRAPFTGIGG